MREGSPNTQNDTDQKNQSSRATSTLAAIFTGRSINSMRSRCGRGLRARGAWRLRGVFRCFGLEICPAFVPSHILLKMVPRGRYAKSWQQHFIENATCFILRVCLPSPKLTARQRRDFDFLGDTAVLIEAGGVMCDLFRLSDCRPI